MQILPFSNTHGDPQPDGCCHCPFFLPCTDALHPTWVPFEVTSAFLMHFQVICAPELCQTACQDLLPAAAVLWCDEGGLKRQQGLCAICLFSCPSPAAWLGTEDKKALQPVAKGLSTAPMSGKYLLWGDTFPCVSSGFMLCSCLKLSIHFALAKHLGKCLLLF